METNNINKIDEISTYVSEVKRKADALLFMRKIAINWYDAAFFNLKMKSSFLLRLRNGKTVLIKNPHDLNDIVIEAARFELLRSKRPENRVRVSKNHIKLKFKGKEVTFYYNSKEKFNNLLCYISENYLEQQFKWLNVSGKQVLDIGANVGDTAIVLALSGAKHIYALDPYSYLYDQAKTNIKLNKLQERITLVNGGCGPQETTLKMNTSYPGTIMKEAAHGTFIHVSTLANLVKKYSIKDGILKMDCEGCEYGIIIGASDDVLRKFSQMMLEYHHGYIDLRKRLENAGFCVTNTVPLGFKSTTGGHVPMYVGMLQAERIDRVKK